MIYRYCDYKILNESFMNEDLSFNDLKERFNKLKDKNSSLQYLIKKYNSVKNLNLRRRLIESILVLYLIITIGFLPDKSEIDKMNNDLVNQSTITIEEIDAVVKDYIELGDNKISKNIFKDPSTLRLSKEARQIIKEHEGLRLEAYKLGDGRITIGYGHSEPISTSKYKIGDKITIEEAEDLFKQDLNYFANSIRRMFKQWEEDGIEIHVTQGMFDAMVSMAYNTGISRLRQSDFIQYLKNGDYLNASYAIQDTLISNKFPGLKDRRNSEYDLFIKDIKDYLPVT